MNTIDQNAKSIFLNAAEIASESQRRDYLAAACGDDAGIRREVEDLLRHHGHEGSLLETPAELAATAVISREEIGTQIGPYKLLEQIGEGGMGVVYLAEQREPVRRRVALKIIKPGLDSRQVVARFEAERQALALMDHPNIAKVLDAGAVSGAGILPARDQEAGKMPAPLGRPFFVMELVRGVPITEYCDQARLTIRQRLALFITICKAVQHAHQKGIIHRDLKPSNVMVALHDGEPVVKVIDFGVAKAVNQQLTEHTLHTGFLQVIGTPLYMSPEQAELSGLDIDTRSDIYSLGVLLYELLTGHLPFDPETLRSKGLDEFRRIVREVDPPRPSGRVSTLDAAAQSTAAGRRSSDARKLSVTLRGEVDWIVMRALEKDRNRRYETASAFAADVERYLSDEPVQACPPSAAYRMRKFMRRNKGPVVAASLVLLTLVVGVAGMAWSLHAEREAKRESDRRLEQVEQGNDILLSFFASLEPRTEAIEGLPLRVLLGRQLDQAAAALDDAAFDDPLTLARMQNGLGRAYLALGYAEQSVPLMEQALETRRRRLGPDHADTLFSMHNLAWAEFAAGEWDQAERLLEQALPRMQLQLGPDHAETLIAATHLGEFYRKLGKHDRSLPLLKETLRLTTAKFGPDHRETLGSMVGLAAGYQEAGMSDQALRLFEEAQRRAEPTLDPQDAGVSAFSTTSGLAVAYRDAGNVKKALPLLEEALRLRTEEFGGDGRQTLVAASNLAVALQMSGELERAESLLEQTVRTMKDKLARNHPDTLIATHNLANVYRDVGNLDLAIPLLEETLPLLRAKLSADHHNTLIAANSLAEAYLDVGRLDEALRLLEDTVPRMQDQLGPDHAETLRASDSLANAYWEAERFDRSVPLYEKLLALRRAKLGNDHSDTVHTLANLAVNYHDAGRLPDAVRVTEEFVMRYPRLPASQRAGVSWFLSEGAAMFEFADRPDVVELILGLRQESERAVREPIEAMN